MAEPFETTQVSGAGASPEQDELLGAVRALSTQVGELRTEVQALRAATRTLPTEAGDVHGWEHTSPPERDGSPWVRSLDGAPVRRPAVPRFALEVGLLVAVAFFAALAELDTPAVVGVMALAWALVAFAEWSASRAARRREELVEQTVLGPVEAGDAAWFGPIVPVRASEPLEEGEAQAGARLPPPAPSS